MSEITPITNVTLDEQLSFSEKLPKGMAYLENNGFMIMGETEEGDEVSFVSCIMRVGGGKDGPWQVDDAFKGQTTLLIAPHDLPKGMNDTPFVGNRTWATDDWTPAKIEKTDEAVTWTLGNRQHICRPPYWQIKGEHMGIEFDLLLTGIGEAAYHKGPYDKLEANNIAGFEHPLCAEGTIKYEGKTYTLRKDKSFGCQEKFTQPAFDLAGVLRGETYYWVWWASERVRIFIYSYPQMNKSYAHVTVDGEDVSFMNNGQADIKMDELEYWVDPQTRLRVPIKWHFSMKHANGDIDMDIEAASRTYYSYLTKSGATMHYGLHSHSEGSMKLADGRVIPLQDMRSYVEHGWTAIPLTAAAE
ncbi:hypothetical protein [Halioxenophilus aromaticivorans]|uniref:Uncharacterized protein n=1 Tax=Halioxenophilus aromaticivorans TaxID=1306992 RepID=A0AAV3U6K6_9ALTE